ncbi:hypothetical protein ACTWP5_10830 [Streptomyces sp. 4N509B]|uniref:hypothetical protein n=1 Tax=Streptomyces sp. 4N509B TaxID=3457413 RepID=UPI003FCF2C82
MSHLREALGARGVTLPSLGLDAPPLGGVSLRPLIRLGSIDLDAARVLATALVGARPEVSAHPRPADVRQLGYALQMHVDDCGVCADGMPCVIRQRLDAAHRRAHAANVPCRSCRGLGRVWCTECFGFFGCTRCTGTWKVPCPECEGRHGGHHEPPGSHPTSPARP